ncbi:YwpF-like family protein [Bacillus sp. CGMCC 1.16541]|uniref:YwpF-like family protein n=1 Tax=Bacillus sp. CGMCC 1.16541 TaxID=2185143 RepID=UPI000D7327DD|nr:YwpF-like family protein [Bacillus sp. CGMCC 1.16541]
MKTFKLVALQFADKHDKPQPVTLLDGLIINKEDGENHWVLEALLDKEYEVMFQRLMMNKETFKVYATISKKSNDPATLSAVVTHITTIGNRISVLMDGLLTERRTNMSEIVLADLIEKGLSGPQLLTQFRLHLQDKKTTRPSAQ